MSKRVILPGILVALAAAPICAGGNAGADKKKHPWPDPRRFEKAIKNFEKQDEKDPPPAGAVLCIGSSSMRGWHRTIRADLAPLTVIPRGFGGSTMRDVIHFADRVVLPYKPRAIVVYEGDNDAAAGVSPEGIRDEYVAFIQRVRKKLPETRFYVLAIKPSISRWTIWPRMKKANALIRRECEKDRTLTFVDIAAPMLGPDGRPRKDIFKSDNLHMNRKGYEIWRDVLRPILLKTEREHEQQE